eukprot:g38737.t1
MPLKGRKSATVTWSGPIRDSRPTATGLTLARPFERAGQEELRLCRVLKGSQAENEVLFFQLALSFAGTLQQEMLARDHSALPVWIFVLLGVPSASCLRFSINRLSAQFKPLMFRILCVLRVDGDGDLVCAANPGKGPSECNE